MAINLKSLKEYMDKRIKGLKVNYDVYKQSMHEKQLYQAELKKAILKSRRDAFKKEAITQAQLKAKYDAKLRYGIPKTTKKKKQPGFFDPDYKVPDVKFPDSLLKL